MLHVPKSLREIVGQISSGGGQGYNMCSCKGKCDSNRYNCKSSNILCNSKHYISIPCKKINNYNNKHRIYKKWVTFLFIFINKY